MIDIKLLRSDPQAVKESQEARGEDPGLVDVAVATDSNRRAAGLRFDEIRAEQKGLGKGSTACLISFHPYFDIGAFKHTFFTRNDGIDMPSTTLDDICNRLSMCDAVIYKDGGPERQKQEEERSRRYADGRDGAGKRASWHVPQSVD